MINDRNLKLERGKTMEYWNGKRKAVTFSYDDGIMSDKRFLQIINQYGIKCTFNLNSGLLGIDHSWSYQNFEVKRLPKEGLIDLYRGHEIAVHGVQHLRLTELNQHELEEEIGCDKTALEQIFQTPVKGMAYSFGEYNNRVIDVLKDKGIKYARTVHSTHDFRLQTNLLEFHPTCHHNDKHIFSLIDQFLKADYEEPLLFYMWGHSYEFDGNQNWDRLEEICKKLSGNQDVFYGTNAEVLL